jgi:hypothetical protein
MLKLKSTAVASMFFAFFSGAALADNAMPVAVGEQQEATSLTCQQSVEIAAIYRELDKTDGNVQTNEPAPVCDENGKFRS